MRPQVKVCGLTRADDVDLAVVLGATHVGFVLAEDSPRAVPLAHARALAARLNENATKSVVPVLVFRKARAAHVLDAVAATGVRRVQVHDADDATMQTLATAEVVLHRVYPIAADARCLPVPQPRATTDAPALFDVGAGGSGRRFAWSLLAGSAPDATFLAGGITPDNLPELLAHRPWGIDLSSGVERLPGVKDAARMCRLFAVLKAMPCP